MYSYDAVVIGGGHNGLVAACYLASRGLKVGVFEANEFLGGMASTPELWRGFKVPVGAYVLSLFHRGLAEELGLFKAGLELIPKDPGMTVLLDNGRVASTWSSLDKTVEEIRRFSEKDSKAYIEWSRFWGFATTVLDYIYLNPPMDIAEALDLALKAVKASKITGMSSLIEDLQVALTAPASRLLDEFFESPEVKALLVEDAVVGELVGPSSPGSALVLAHHYMGNITGVRGQWAYVKGGMGRLSELLAERCRSLGVDVHLGSRVEEIIVRNGSLAGVRVNGRVYRAKFALSSVDARVTLLDLLKWDEAGLDKRLVRRLRSLKSIGVSSKVVAALRGLPKLRGAYSEYADRIFRSSALTIESVDYVERAYREALAFGASREPWISINTQSYLDPTVAPEGWHIISLFTQYTRYDSPGGWDEASREKLANTVFEVLDRYFENFKGGVEKTLVLTPRDYEDLFKAPGGHIFHISATLDQLWINRPLPELSKYRTPIKGLYLCGSSTHPGGGVTGLPGYLAARTLLEDIGVERPKRTPLRFLLRMLRGFFK